MRAWPFTSRRFRWWNAPRRRSCCTPNWSSIICPPIPGYDVAGTYRVKVSHDETYSLPIIGDLAEKSAAER